MALTIANEMKAAALDGMLALLNGGSAQLLTGGSSELAAPTFGSPAFGAATVASPSVAAANTLTADNSITAGTIGLFSLKTSGGSARLSGTVGVGSGDFQVTDNVIPGTATSVTLASLSVSLQLT